MSRGFKLSVLAAAVMAVAPAAQAFEAGDFVLRAGAVHVAPDDYDGRIMGSEIGLAAVELAAVALAVERAQQRRR